MTSPQEQAALPFTNVYIDGFNLYYGCLKGSPYRWLDLDALCKKLLPKHDIRLIRYFTARITARPGDHGHRSQLIYLRALQTFSNISIHYGEFRETRVRMPLAHPSPGGPRTVQVIKTEEKGSDVNLGSYMLLDAAKGGLRSAVAITNDSDLAEPIHLIRSEFGLITGVINPHATTGRSRNLDATFFKQIRPAALKQSQLPATLIDDQGRAIQKPSSW